MNFTFTTAGESHGKALVAIIEGLPARFSYVRRVRNLAAAAKVRGLFWQHQFPIPQANLR